MSYQLIDAGFSVVVLDVDPHVVAALTSMAEGSEALLYDVAEALPESVRAACTAVFIDAPWYDDMLLAFFARGFEALEPGGILLASCPPRLTKPGVERMMTKLVEDLIASGHHLLAYEREQLSYAVPRFEAAALTRDGAFSALPWRKGDLLMFRKGATARFEAPPPAKLSSTVYARNWSDFRVFIGTTATCGDQLMLRPVAGYKENVSARAYKGPKPDLWTSEKDGFSVGNAPLIRDALLCWSDGQSADETANALQSRHGHLGAEVVEQLNAKLLLWTRFAAVPPLRRDEDIVEAKRRALSNLATIPSEREHGVDREPFRDQFQRDRDRIIWSVAFRRTAHKTQLFPVEHDDAVRQRLTHSIEVVQLASTIGWSFGLDQTLIEAGGLAHDIGHTPFGHAGEHALDSILRNLIPKGTGFNHYEHGVDVVRWLEGPYHASADTPHHGLNLTPEVAECILKHAFCQNPDPGSRETLLEHGKHGGFIRPGLPHLEGQAVRIADKISYLVSDLEDGIRLGALRRDDLLACRLFHRASLNFAQPGAESLLETFSAQRRLLLKVLMEDVLVASNKNLSHFGGGDPRDANTYLISYSDGMTGDVNEVWTRLQRGRLHQDRRVRTTNLRAARIVSDLCLLLTLCPELIDEGFREEHERLWGTSYMSYYRKQVSHFSVPQSLVARLPLEHLIGFAPNPSRAVKTEHLVQAKDYVAALSDNAAVRAHREFLGG